MTVNVNGTLMFNSGEDRIFLSDYDGITTSGIDYISLDLYTKFSSLKPEAWIKWGEHTYCYEINEVVAFKALALFLDTESLGKAGNFIKKNGVVTWSDSPTCLPQHEVVA